ncbi:MAG: DUF4175 family protein, partial [Alphaproteobacteria bacterium]
MTLWRRTPYVLRSRLRLMARLRRRLRLAKAALLWEQLWPALWPAVLTAGLGLAAALFDLLPSLPGLVHAAILLIWGVLMIALIVRAVRSVRLPDRRAARRRLEQASGLAHRPLLVLEDHPAEPDLEAPQWSLWRAHRRRMLAKVTRLKVGVPAGGLTRRDPYGLRVVVALVLLLAVIDARGEAWQRIVRAASPDMSAFAPPPVSLDLWVTPPAYTGLAPVVLRRAAAAATGKGAPAVPETDSAGRAAVDVPAGSKLLAQVHGGRGTPELVIGGKVLAFERVGERSFKAAGPIERTGRISVRQGRRELAAFDVTLVPDKVPTIELARPPSGTERGVLRLDYRARDDYGVVSAKAIVEHRTASGMGIRDLAVPATPPDGGPPQPGDRLALPLTAPPGQGDAVLTSYNDLSAHPWAGLEVTLWLEAVDAAGQTGRSAAQKLTLPERRFTNPVARDIIAARKKLALVLSMRRQVAEDLARIGAAPERFNNDTVVYLALRSAAGRLMLDPDPSAVPSVQALLWDTALRLEDGGAAVAERALRDAEKALQEALDRGADSAEVAKLLDELHAAMEAYMDALAQSFGEERSEGEAMEAGPNGGQMVRREDLMAMLDRVRELARNGDRDAARRALSKLQDVMENLRVPRPDRDAKSEQARQTLSRLRDIVNRQKDLLDRSFQASKRPPQRSVLPPGLFPPGLFPPGFFPPEMNPPESGPPARQGEGAQSPGESAQGESGLPQPPQGGGAERGTGDEKGKTAPGKRDFAADAEAQERLRHDLGDVMLGLGEQLGEIPSQLGRAEFAMREATRALEGNNPG